MWKVRTPADARKHRGGEQDREVGREIENAYRRGYVDGARDASDLVSGGGTPRQARHWAWSILPSWRKSDIEQRTPPPQLEPWDKQRKRILKRDKSRCTYCGQRATHVDHVVPVSRGGSYDDSNLVACCADCNISKGDLLLSEWVKRP